MVNTQQVQELLAQGGTVVGEDGQDRLHRADLPRRPHGSPSG